MKEVELHAAASDEVVEAVAWYDRARSGLGLELFASFETVLVRIRAAPGSFPRRVVLRRFPYAVLFVERENVILVVAFAHLRRRPGYWRRRLVT